MHLRAPTVTATGPMHRVLSSPPAVRFEQTEWALPRAAMAAGTRRLLAALADGADLGGLYELADHLHAQGVR